MKQKIQSIEKIWLIMAIGLIAGLIISWVMLQTSFANGRASAITATAGNDKVEIDKLSTPALIDNTPAIKVGVPAASEAPDFELENLEGQKIRLSDFRGKAVLLNFWASWCGPCQKEMPFLNQIAVEYRSAGLVVLGVNVTSQDTLEGVQKMAAKYNLSFPVLLDKTGSTMMAFQAYGLPTSFFIDVNGMIRHVQYGELSEQATPGLLSKIIQNP